jgi:hypothetical protein
MTEERISDTRFKLQEAEYFLNQMKKTADDMTEFIFNQIAFVSAARSVTFVMQKEYKKSEGEDCEGEDDPFWKWYVLNVQEPLKKDEDAVYFNILRVKFLHTEGNPRGDLRKVVTKTFVARYNIIGSTTENMEDKSTDHNLEQESTILPQQSPQPTITDDPEAQDLNEKYFWILVDIEDKAKTSKKYVFPTCEKYHQRLRFLVNECEKQFKPNLKL